MAGQIGIRGRKKKDILDCPRCKSSLRFSGLGRVIDYCNGYETPMSCPVCKKSFICQEGQLLREHGA